MKKINLLKLIFCSLLLLNMGQVIAQDTSDLTDGPQTLESTETDSDVSPKTETPAKTESIPAASTEASATTSEMDLSNSTPENKRTQVTIDKKNPNGEVLSEEDLLKPKSKKDSNSKVASQKISESEIFIQESEKYKINDNFKSLKLNDVIEQGIRKNYDQGLRNQKENLSDLTFDGVKKSFWIPSVKLTLSTDDQLISLIRKSSRAQSTNNPKTPSGYVGLELGDYTVFNWGKDYALYLNKKSTYDREKQVYSESKRELKLDLIYNYFNLISTKNVEKIRQDQLRQASFIYRLNKEKITIGKTSQQDYYQARVEYLKAQSDFHEAKMQTDIADENMSFLIADEVGTKYVLTENLDYKRIKMSLPDAISLANSQNPTLLTNKSSLQNAERAYDIAQKENLPLPKFSMNLGAYKKSFGPTSNQTVYETTSGNGNIELVASINATWDLTGEDGLFNSNKLAKSRINKELANYELYKNKHYAESMVRETYKNILSYQNQMLILEARLPSVQKTFDTVLENYLNAKAKYNDFHLALIDLSDTKIVLEKLKLNHLKEKLTLAKLIGAEDFPGENFEHLALKVKGK